MKGFPLIILAGSDPEPAALPEAGANLHPLKGAKGMDLRIGGRPIIDLLLDFFRIFFTMFVIIITNLC